MLNNSGCRTLVERFYCSQTIHPWHWAIRKDLNGFRGSYYYTIVIILDIEIRALKIYSPDGPRNGVIIIFLTQSSKNLWLTKISEVIKFCTPDPVFPPSPPLTGGPVVTPPPSPAQTHRRRVSLGIIQNGNFSSSSSNHMGGNKHSPVGGVKSLGMSSSSSSSLSSSSSSMDVKKSPVMISRTHSLFSFDPDGKLLTNNTKYVYMCLQTM